jgi:hypothetical protein
LEKVFKIPTTGSQQEKVCQRRKKRVFAPRELTEIYNAARYVSKQGWDGFPAGAIRAALIRACGVINDGPKMVMMKMSIFVEPDGWDKAEPQIPLIRILNAKPVMQKDIGRDGGFKGSPLLIIRPVYHGWSAKLKLAWDGDQYNVNEVYNLLMRAGLQVGIMEGRPASKNSAGQGWGTFEVSKNNIQVVSWSKITGPKARA